MLQCLSLLIASSLFILLGIIANDSKLIYGMVLADVIYFLLVFILTL